MKVPKAGAGALLWVWLPLLLRLLRTASSSDDYLDVSIRPLERVPSAQHTFSQIELVNLVSFFEKLP